MKPARRLDSLPMYMFAALATRLKKLQAQGLDVIRLDMGAPDGPPTAEIIEALHRSAQIPANHNYAGYYGAPALRQAIVDYYRRRFGVALNVADEVLPLIGSKEGIANIALAWLDPGDVVLVPDPGYPPYRMGAALAGANVHLMPLRAEAGFLPDLSAIPARIAKRARMMWLNYPNNPTGAIAPLRFLVDAVDFCRKHEILLCHDAPYAEVCFDGYQAPSLMAIPGASKVAVEFNSLSKSHNMAGWRVGMAVGNKIAVQALLQTKSNIDTGNFLPIQDAAVVALTGDQGWLAERNAIYQQRRDLLYAALRDGLGLQVAKPLASLYLWPHVPAGHTSASFTEKLLLEAGLSVTSGAEFGPSGEGYVRISVGQTTSRVVEAADRLRKLKL